jgi:hypothetical protein
MSVSRRTRLSVLAAAVSGALVVAMTGTALATGRADRPSCTDLDRPCESIPAVHPDEDVDDGAPATTPAAAPEEDVAGPTTRAAITRTTSSGTPGW